MPRGHHAMFARPPMPSSVVAAVVVLLLAVTSTVLALVPNVHSAEAAPSPRHVFRGDGDQESGRWQVFPVDLPEGAPVTAFTSWNGDGDVDVFLLADGEAIASSKGDDQPERIEYRGKKAADEVAVLIDSGSATFVTEVYAGPSPSEPQLSPDAPVTEPTTEPTSEPEPDPSSEPAPEPVIAQEIRSSGDQTSGRWQLFPLALPQGSPVTIFASWTGEGDVNMFLRASGTTVAQANSETAPYEKLVYEGPDVVDELAVLVKTGAANYAIEVYVGDAPDQPQLDPAGTDPTTEPTAEPTAEPTSEPTSEPTAEPSPEPTSDPTPDAGTAAAFPGAPEAGTVLWGASVTGNTDPAVRHEQPAGVPVGVRRTFFQWRHRTSYMVDTAQHDLSVGRLPWVSIKPPSWADMAAGQHDAEIDQMLQALDALDGPVWLTVHHEPEGGSGVNSPDDPAGPAGHVAMNRRVRERMTALGVDNIALAPVLMSWTFDPGSGRNPDEWWGPGIYDFFGVDHYRDEEATLLTQRWNTVRTWAAARDVDVAVGEWGMRGSDAAAGQRVRDWYTAATGSATDGNGARVIALSAFDSSLNSPTGSWELTGDQLDTFHDLMQHPDSTHP